MVMFLNKDVLFLEFVKPEDAKWVFEAGRRSFRGNPLQLEWWHPDSGCVKRKDMVYEALLRVVGLPLHLWTGEILERIEDSCGGLIALDKEMVLKTELRWAHFLVRLGGRARPSMIHVEARTRIYELQIWLELPPWCSGVFPLNSYNESATHPWEEEGEEPPRT